MNKFILILLLLTYACSTRIQTQGTRMISPEAEGSLGKGTVDFRLQGHQNGSYNFENDRIGNDVRKGTDTYSGAVGGNLGLLRKLDVYLIANFNSSVSPLGFKYQFIGEPKQKAKKGNFSLSTAVDFGSASSKYHGDAFFGGDNTIEHLRTETTEYALGVIAGYRWLDELLHYVNVYGFNQDIEGKVKTQSHVLDHDPFEYNRQGLILSTGIMYHYKKAILKFDYSHVASRWDRGGSQSSNLLNFAAGFHW